MKELLAKQLIAKLDDLPTLPSIATQVLHLAASDSTNVKELSKLIENDPALTAKILRTVNSAYAGLSQPVTTIDRAMVFLGFKIIRNMVLSVKIFDYFGSKNIWRDPFSRELWLHSIGTGAIAALIAKRKKLDPDELFVQGLLHDMGKIALYNFFKKEYEKIILKIENGEEYNLSLEENIFGVDHTSCGKLLAEKWKFPEDLKAVLQYHHQPFGSTLYDTKYRKFVEIVHFANLMSKDLRIGYDDRSIRPHIHVEHLKYMELATADYDSIMREVRTEVKERLVFLNQEYDDEQIFFDALQKANAALGRINEQINAMSMRLEKQNDYFRGLHDINMQLAPGISMPQALEILAEKVRSILDVTNTYCFYIDTDKKYLFGKKAMPDDKMEDFMISLGDNKRGNIACFNNDNKIIDKLVTYIMGEESPDQSRSEIKVDELEFNLYIIPLHSQSRHIGGLIIDNRDGLQNVPLKDRWDMIAAFASTCELALSRIYLRDSLEVTLNKYARSERERARIENELLQAKKLAAIGQMAAGTAHEINNPLAIISGKTQILLRKETDEVTRKSLEEINRQCMRMHKIITDLLGYAKPTKPQITTVDIADLVLGLRNAFEDSLKTKNIHLRVNLPQDIPPVRADLHQVEEVLHNLIRNAEHAMESKGKHLTVSVIDEYSDGYVKICIEDEGQGIGPENLDKIFDPFFTTKEVGIGTGLGLSISYSLVKANKGKIDVASKLGEGSIFTVSLPIERKENEH